MRVSTGTPKRHPASSLADVSGSGLCFGKSQDSACLDFHLSSLKIPKRRKHPRVMPYVAVLVVGIISPSWAFPFCFVYLRFNGAPNKLLTIDEIVATTAVAQWLEHRSTDLTVASSNSGAYTLPVQMLLDLLYCPIPAITEVQHTQSDGKALQGDSNSGCLAAKPPI